MRFLSEDHKEIETGKKLDDEGYMARAELDNIESSVKALRKIIKKPQQQLPAWVQSKITKAADYISTAADYLESDEEIEEHYYNGLSLTERILREMGCDCDLKKHKTVEEIAKIHNTTVARIKKQLKMGIKIEGEHTTDPHEAEVIALQHLEEKPDYYTKLKRVEESKSGDKSLHDWFNKSSGTDPKTGRKVKGWVQIGGPYAGAPCARQPGQESTPKCTSSDRAEELSDDEETTAFRRKNKKDPNQPEKTGGAKPTYVKTESFELDEAKGEKDACYHKVKSRYRVFPSAYASGALVKCRKVGADKWGNKSIDEAVRIQPQSGQLIHIVLNWKSINITTQLFFPQISIPKRREVLYAVEKIYPGAKIITYRVSDINPQLPLIQTVKEDSEPYGLAEEILSEFKSPAWTRKEGQSETGGLNKKGIAAYRRENPGSKLSLAVTTKPSKLKKGSKKWKRRKSFCARMGGMPGPMKDKKGRPTRKALSLRKWNC